MNDAHMRARAVKLLVMDVDGVLTDGRLYFDNNGQESKAFHSLDGHGMKMLRSSGVEMAIITGRTSGVVLHRAQNLGIDPALVHQGAADKKQAYEALMAQVRLAHEQIAYMGDDVVDLPVMIRCGLAISVPAAPVEVQQRAHLVTTREGGMGAVREACEFIMKAQGTWADMLAHYLA